MAFNSNKLVGYSASSTGGGGGGAVDSVFGATGIITSLSPTGTNTLNPTTASFSVRDTTDITKVGKFDASAITTATTRTFTLPNVNGTFALVNNQTFTGTTTMANSTVSTLLTTDSIQTAGATGVVLRNSGGTAVLTVGASAGTGATLAGATSVNGLLSATAGATITNAKTTTAAATTTYASLNIPVGVAPTSPVAGDMWSTGTGNLSYRDGTTTTNLLAGAGFSWGATATNTSGTGLALTLGNSSASSTTGLTITAGNTQTNTNVLLDLTTGTSTPAGGIRGIRINQNSTGSGLQISQGATTYSADLLSISGTAGNFTGVKIGFNRTSEINSGTFIATTNGAGSPTNQSFVGGTTSYLNFDGTYDVTTGNKVVAMARFVTTYGSGGGVGFSINANDMEIRRGYTSSVTAESTAGPGAVFRVLNTGAPGALLNGTLLFCDGSTVTNLNHLGLDIRNAGISTALSTITTATTLSRKFTNINADTTAGAFTVTLPAIATVSTADNTITYSIANIAAVNNLTIACNGAETITGVATIAVTPGTSVRVRRGSATNWILW